MESEGLSLQKVSVVTLIACFKNREGGGATPGSDDFNGSGPLNNIKTP